MCLKHPCNLESPAASMNPSPSSSAPLHTQPKNHQRRSPRFSGSCGVSSSPLAQGVRIASITTRNNYPDDGQNAVAHGFPSQHEYPLMQTAKQESPFTQTG
jgi:hypothetical protein